MLGNNMNEAVITVENLSKRYVIGREKAHEDGLRHVLERAIRAPWKLMRNSSRVKSGDLEEFWALKDVDFQVAKGEVVGIIGRNGAGKSTLLKILSRITEPTHGRIRMHGRVASLLEVGTGFHGELTGRENIFLNGAILGMSRAEIRRKFDEIVAFAEVERFIDTPVKRYSSGMYVRLAFAVAAHLEPEILIVDEVLAVGDLEFQRKCLARMDRIAHTQGRTILFVSHNMASIQNLCTKCVLLERGRLRLIDTPEMAIQKYIEEIMPSEIGAEKLATTTNRSGNGTIIFTDFHIEDEEGNRLAHAISGMSIKMVFSYRIRDGSTVKRVDVGLSVAQGAEQLLFVLYSSYTGLVFEPDAREGAFICKIEKLPLTEGRYVIGGRMIADKDEADWPRDGLGYLDVEQGDFFGTGSSGFTGPTSFLVDGEWSLASARARF